MLSNTRESWGSVAKTLHWSAGAFVFAMLGLGLTMVHGDLGAGAKFEAYQLHKSTRGDDRVGLAHGLGVVAAASSAPSRRLRRAQSHRPECAAGGADEIRP